MSCRLSSRHLKHALKSMLAMVIEIIPFVWLITIREVPWSMQAMLSKAGVARDSAKPKLDHDPYAQTHSPRDKVLAKTMDATRYGRHTFGS